MLPIAQKGWQISTDGGFEPKWRGDGRELYYIGADQQMMAVEVTDDNVFSIGRPNPLFKTEVLGASAYAIRIVLNWRDLVRMPAN